MQLDFKNLFNSGSEIINFDYILKLDDFIYSTYNPLKNGAKVKGKAYNRAGVVYLDVNVEFDFFGFCDRCAEPIEKHYTLDFNKIIVSHLENNNDDYDDYIVIENGILNLDELIDEEIQLFLPLKMLCDVDCKGLCYQCGKNLNFEKCDCKKDVDPRMQVLLQLLDEE